MQEKNPDQIEKLKETNHTSDPSQIYINRWLSIRQRQFIVAVFGTGLSILMTYLLMRFLSLLKG